MATAYFTDGYCLLYFPLLGFSSFLGVIEGAILLYRFTKFCQFYQDRNHKGGPFGRKGSKIYLIQLALSFTKNFSLPTDGHSKWTCPARENIFAPGNAVSVLALFGPPLRFTCSHCSPKRGHTGFNFQSFRIPNLRFPSGSIWEIRHNALLHFPMSTRYAQNSSGTCSG